jgi:hypothetical protein
MTLSSIYADISKRYLSFQSPSLFSELILSFFLVFLHENIVKIAVHPMRYFYTSHLFQSPLFFHPNRVIFEVVTTVSIKHNAF